MTGIGVGSIAIEGVITPVGADPVDVIQRRHLTIFGSIGLGQSLADPPRPPSLAPGAL
jgi:hypothetical protein